VDISHDVRPQDVEQAAFLVACAHGYFPPGSIHVAVVDPGVGTDRCGLALATPDFMLVGPDNGVLSAALPDAVREAVSGPQSVVTLPVSILGHSLSNNRYHRQPVSPTFHARDIFGPVAGQLSLGVEISELGPAVHGIIALPPFRAAAVADGSLIGRVIHIDRFGNVITTVCADQLPSSAEVQIAGRVIASRTGTYAEAAGLTTLIGSCGYLEIALRGGSARDTLGVSPGDPVIVRPV
jgi:S-adenosyl-L-methionine hydrolase (adenosine-forming)